MFNTYTKTGDLHINAVAGTLVRNHPKSRFIVAREDNCIFDETRPTLRVRAEVYGNYRPIQKPCVVLQAMIIRDGLFLCEVVLDEDLEGGAT